MKKNLRLFCCLLLCCIGGAKAVAGVAEEEAKYLVLTLADDTYRDFQLADKPVILFQDGKLVVSAASVIGEFDREDVKSFDFRPEPTAIERATAEGRVVFRYVDNTSVALFGVPDTGVSLYDAAGRLVSRPRTIDGRVEIGLQTLAPGTYVLQYDKKSCIKFIKK